MTYEQIEKEFDEKFTQPNYGWGSEGYETEMLKKTTPNRIKSFLKQSFIKYLQSEVDWLKTQYQDEHPVDCIDGETPVETYGYEETYNQSIKNQITHLQAQIKELQ